MNMPVIVSAFECGSDGKKSFGVVINLSLVRKFRPLEKFDNDEYDERLFVISYVNGDTEHLFIDPAHLAQMLELGE